MVFWGDSLSVQGSPSYPELLPETLGRDALEVTNASEPGTTSADWTPGAERFENSLAPNLAGADVVFVTVGGNDLQEAFGASTGPEALDSERDQSRLEQVTRAFGRIERNLRRSFRAIRRAEPGVAIVFVGYPDYSQATVWRERTDTFGRIALRTGIERIDAAAEAAGADHVLEMLDATAGAGVDGLLADAEHLGPDGHRFYAEEIARRLGRR